MYQGTVRWVLLLVAMLTMTGAVQRRGDGKVIPKDMMEPQEGHLFPRPDRPRSRDYRHVLQQLGEGEEYRAERIANDNHFASRPLDIDLTSTLMGGEKLTRGRRSPGRVSTVLSTRLRTPRFTRQGHGESAKGGRFAERVHKPKEGKISKQKKGKDKRLLKKILPKETISSGVITKE